MLNVVHVYSVVLMENCTPFMMVVHVLTLTVLKVVLRKGNIAVHFLVSLFICNISQTYLACKYC